MVKHYLLFILGLVASVLLCFGQSQAFVVQNPRRALSFNNIVRDTSLPKSEDEENGKKTSSDDCSPVNYGEIADKLLPNQEELKFYVDMQKKSVQNIYAKPGQSFFVILPEEDGSSWHFDEKFKLAEIVSSEHDHDRRILEFRVLCCGEESFFIDNILANDRQYEVLQSKIIRLRVQK